MSAPAEERRRALVARSDRDRDALGAIVDGIERKFAVAEAVVATARGLVRHRVWIGAAGLVLILAPHAARRWVRRAMWIAPLAIKWYRASRAENEARPASSVDL